MGRKEQSRTRRGVVVLKKELIVAVKGVRDNSGCETTATMIGDRTSVSIVPFIDGDSCHSMERLRLPAQCRGGVPNIQHDGFFVLSRVIDSAANSDVWNSRSRTDENFEF